MCEVTLAAMGISDRNRCEAPARSRRSEMIFGKPPSSPG